MRPIVPLVFKGIKPVNMAGVPGFDFDIVDPCTLLVDDAYQRGLSDKSMALIRRMVEGWDWAKSKCPTCVRVDGQLHVIDGQHTAIAAASHGGINLIPVLVVAAPTVEDRASAFVSHAKNRLQATRTQVHRALCAAGDADALRLQRIVDAVGMSLVPSPKSPLAYRAGETYAVSTVWGVITKRGDKLAKDVLGALVQSGITPIAGADIRAAEMLLCDDAYASDMDVERVAMVFRTRDDKQKADAEALSIAKRMPLWQTMASVLYRDRNVRRKAPAAEPPTASPTEFRSVFPTAAAGPAAPAARIIDRRHRGVVPIGEPEPGRSALDERRRATA